jgi:hypothetical protein
MPLHPARPLAALIGLALSAGACAQTSPYYIGANQAFGYRSNLYSSETDPLSSAMSITSLVFGVDQPIGRQRFYASGNVGYNYFFEPDARVLNTSYSLNMGLTMTVERYRDGADRRQPEPRVLRDPGAAPNTNERNIQNTGEAELNGATASRRGSASRRLTYRTVSFSDPGYAYQEYAPTSAAWA